MDLLFINIGKTELYFLLTPLLFILVVIWNIIKHKDLTYNQKILWIVIVLVGNILGALIYWIWGRNIKSINSAV